MTEALKFWLARDVADFLTACAVFGGLFVGAFILVWWSKR